MIFVVGPSGGGKTTLLNAILPEFPVLELLDLDAEEIHCVKLILARGDDPRGWEGRWRRNLECLLKAEARPDVDVIVDVGAGSLETADGRRFFVERWRSTIAVVAPWPVVYERRHLGRTPEEFQRIEYSEERQKVYRAARFRVDSICDKDESVRQLRAAIQELLSDKPVH
jgi:shikimate kinase